MRYTLKYQLTTGDGERWVQNATDAAEAHRGLSAIGAGNIRITEDNGRAVEVGELPPQEDKPKKKR